MDNNTGVVDRGKLMQEKILFLLRGYIVPVIGGSIILLVLIFIYYPNVTGIISDWGKLSDDNDTYTQIKDRIVYYKNLSSADSQLTLSENLIAIGGVIPDDAKGADTINMIQGVAQNDGLQLVSANAQLLTASQLSSENLSPLVKIVQVTVNVNGSADNARKLFTDLTTMKQVVEVVDATIKGAVAGSSPNQISFIVQVYAMSSTDLENGVNILKPINTSYQTEYINRL